MLFRNTPDRTQQQALAEFEHRLLLYLRSLRNLTLGCTILIFVTGIFAPRSPHEAFFVTGSQLLAIGSVLAMLSLWIFLSLLYQKITKPVTTPRRESAPITQPS